MRIAVVDDDIEFRNCITEYVSRYFGNDERLFSVSSYGSGLDFLSEYKCNFDIVLLDIQMPKICGMDVASELRKIDENVVIMFITQTSSFAIRGYEVNALDYVLKPLDYESGFKYKFDRAVKAASAKLSNEKDLLLSDDNGGIVRVKLSEFIYVVKEKDTAVFYTTRGVFRKRVPLFKIEEMLEGAPVAVANSGCLVHLFYVKNIGDNVVTLTNGDTVVLSRGKKKEFFAKFFDYINKHGGGV